MPTARTGGRGSTEGRDRIRSENLGQSIRMPSWGHLLIVRGKTLRWQREFTAQALSMPRRSRILFGAAPEQRCIFATPRHPSTCAARQMATSRWCILVTPRGMYIIEPNLPKVRGRRWGNRRTCRTLIADLGVDRASRRKGGGDHFRLPVMEEPTDNVRPLLARLGEPKLCCG